MCNKHLLGKHLFLLTSKHLLLRRSKHLLNLPPVLFSALTKSYIDNSLLFIQRLLCIKLLASSRYRISKMLKKD